MTVVRMQILLPYSIAILDGEYEIYAARHLRTLRFSHPEYITYEAEAVREILECEGKSLASMDFTTDVDISQIQNVMNEFARCANITLTTVNRLVAWYRAQTKRHYITELVLPQVEFALFSVVEPVRRDLRLYRYKEPRPVNEILSDEEMEVLKQNVSNPQPPPLEELLLLDAEEALSQHRYKECILICWSAIESIFDPLIRAKLKERLPDIGFDIGQAGWNIERDLWFFTRLDVLPRLLADFSFKGLPDDFWNRLQSSRNVRNQVVHEGEDVEEDDAANTLAVTREFVNAVKAFRGNIN